MRITIKWLLIQLLLLIGFVSCNNDNVPELSVKQKLRDFNDLYNYSINYNPFYSYNCDFKKCPRPDTLYSYYENLIKNSKNNLDFLRIISAYLELIGQSGHCYIPPSQELREIKWINLYYGKPIHASFSDFTKAQYWANIYWNLDWWYHAPFFTIHKNDAYYTGTCWMDSVSGINVPIGSQILKVNGLSCCSFMDSVLKNTWINYYSYNTDWIRNYLFVINETELKKGWKVDFLINDSLHKNIFVPAYQGLRTRVEQFETIEKPKLTEDNCICIKISDSTAYISIRSFKYSYRADKKKIQKFFNSNKYKFSKVIIDVRGNDGGLDKYGYDILIKPFLKKASSIDNIVAVKQKFIEKYSSNLIKMNSLVKTSEVSSITNPDTLKYKDFSFFKVHKTLKPENTYPFNGKLYILIDNGVFSATEDYIYTIKKLGLATLIGSNSYGGAAFYFASPVFRLPESGIMIRMEVEMSLNQDGTINEIYGTIPDIEKDLSSLPKNLSLKDLRENKLLKEIIEH